MLFQAKLHWVKSTLSSITSPWETWSLHSCEESKARKQTRKSTGLKSWGSWIILNLMIVNYYFRMFYTYIKSNYIKYISICIYHIGSTHIFHISNRLCIYLHILYIYIFIFAAWSFSYSPSNGGSVFFLPLVVGWIILPRFGRFLRCKDLRYLNKPVKWLEATQLSSTYPCLEHNKKQMHNLVLVSKTSLMNTKKSESETRYINFEIMPFFGLSMLNLV